MCCHWWKCHESAAVFKKEYTIEQHVLLSENLPRLEHLFKTNFGRTY
jgi:hypothetical protein